MSLGILPGRVPVVQGLTLFSFLPPRTEQVDVMPQASTCSCTLYLPNYSS